MYKENTNAGVFRGRSRIGAPNMQPWDTSYSRSSYRRAS